MLPCVMVCGQGVVARPPNIKGSDVCRVDRRTLEKQLGKSRRVSIHLGQGIPQEADPVALEG